MERLKCIFQLYIEGEFSNPTLTTIKEPMYALGRKALLVLEDVFEGKDKPSKIYIPTELVIRNSCGCESNILEESYKHVNTTLSKHVEGDYSEKLLFKHITNNKYLKVLLDIEKILPICIEQRKMGEIDMFFMILILKKRV